MPSLYQRTATALQDDPDCIAVSRINAWSAQYQALYVGRVIAVQVIQIHLQTLRIEQAGSDRNVGTWLASGGEYQIWAWGKQDDEAPWQVEVTPILMPDGWLERWCEKQAVKAKEASDE